MKNRIKTLLTILPACVLGISLSACESPFQGHYHRYAGPVEEKAATCTESGMAAFYSCPECGKFFDINKKETTLEDLKIPALGHRMVHHDEVESSDCCTHGVVEYYECTRCSKIFSDEAGNHEITSVEGPTGAHTLVHYAAVAADCVTAGNSEYWACTFEGCGKYFSDAEAKNEIAKNSWVIRAKGHNLTKTDAQAATCTENGNKDYWTCSDCHKVFQDAEAKTEFADQGWVIEALQHDYEEAWSFDDASHWHACTHNAEHKDGLTEHEYKYSSSSEEGKHTKSCTVCDYSVVEAHVFDKEVAESRYLVQAATCDKPAKYYKSCACGESSNDLEQTFAYGECKGHTYVHHDAVAASYAAGCVEYYSCEDCDKLFVKDGENYVEKTAAQISLAQRENAEFVSSAENPYLISSIDDLKALRDDVNSVEVPEPADGEEQITDRVVFEDKFFKLTTDLTFELEEETTHGVDFGSPIGFGNVVKFGGTFDGDNHTIENLYISGTDNQGLFSRLNGTAKNIKFKNAVVEATNAAGRAAVLAGRAENATIQNVEAISGTITTKREAAGIAASILGTVTIDNCINRIDVESSEGPYVGGIAAYVHSSGTYTISNCKNYGKVTGHETATGIVGGIVGGPGAGTPTIKISYAENNGDVQGYYKVGGIVGRASGTLTMDHVKNNGEIIRDATNAFDLGGILGTNVAGGTISYAENNGKVTALKRAGGIVAFSSSASGLTIDHALNTGDITVDTLAVGGINGYNEKVITIKDSTNEGKSTSGTNTNGGILGFNNGAKAVATIQGCDNKGTITGTSSIGGIVGNNATGKLSITECTNSGAINASGTGAAGIIGTTSGAHTLSLVDCENNGVVTSTSEGAGGILGYCNVAAKTVATITVSGCTNNAAVSGKGNGVGGIVGATAANSALNITVTNCTNNGNVTGVNYVGGIGGLIRTSATGSGVTGCINNGNITATTFAGGILGTARVNATDCQCLGTATLTIGTTSYTASTLGAKGGGKLAPGYIAAAAEGGSTVSGTILVP